MIEFERHKQVDQLISSLKQDYFPPVSTLKILKDRRVLAVFKQKQTKNTLCFNSQYQ